MPFSFLPRMIYPHLTDVRAEDPDRARRLVPDAGF